MKRVDVAREQIEQILPHRSPFLFVDAVRELDAGKRILAELELRADEPHFEGHFPGRPIMPGVLIAEALAQTSGLLLALSAMVRTCRASRWVTTSRTMSSSSPVLRTLNSRGSRLEKRASTTLPLTETTTPMLGSSRFCVSVMAHPGNED